MLQEFLLTFLLLHRRFTFADFFTPSTVKVITIKYHKLKLSVLLFRYNC